MRTLFAVCILLISVSLKAQVVVFSEDFEGSNLKVSSSAASSTTASWALSNSLQSNGVFSDTAIVTLSDTLYLETDTFSTIGYSFVTLGFEQICKISFFDRAFVEVSADSGQTWTRLTSTEYLGSGFFNQNAFNSVSYAVWDPVNNNATPTNSWWQTERFDISALANVAYARVRFVLVDADNNGPVNNYGWLVDEIEVTAAPCELIPPSITLVGTIYQSLVYNTGPYTVEADIVDASGIASASLTYTVNNGNPTTLSMSLVSGTVYEATIPSASIGDTICYSITATDNTTCGNIAIFPTNGCTQFIISSAPPPTCVGTPVFRFNYLEDFGTFVAGNGFSTVGTLQNNWINETNDDHDWFVLNRATTSGNTGPASNYSITDQNFLYVEASGFSGDTAILNTPCYDLSNLLAPKFRFWYHMWDGGAFGNNMGDLRVDIYSGGRWVLDIMPVISGDQGNQWLFREIDLTPYTGNIVKLRFRAIVGTGFRSDIAIDEVSIYEPLVNDIGITKVFSPAPNGCNGSAAEFVTLELANYGSAAQDTIPLAYRVNNGSIVRDTAFFTLNAADTSNFTFQQTVNMATQGTYNFEFWLEGNDGNATNDSILTYSVVTSNVSTQFPDSNDFDQFTTGTPGTLLDGWSNNAFDTHDWYANTAGTPSNGTGPSADHTSGTGNYMYVEATGFNNTTAILNMKCYDTRNLNKATLDFYYHMQGINMGELHVDLDVNGFVFQDITPPIIGTQGINWNFRSVDLSPYFGTIRVMFRAVVGNGFESDIAIDDAIVYDAQPVGFEKYTISANDYKLFPNPTSDRFSINNKENILTIRIFDFAGKLVMTSAATGLIDISLLERGIYQVEIETIDASIVRKQIIKN